MSWVYGLKQKSKEFTLNFLVNINLEGTYLEELLIIYFPVLHENRKFTGVHSTRHQTQFPFMPVSCQWSPYFKHEVHISYTSNARYMSPPSSPPRFYFRNNIFEYAGYYVQNVKPLCLHFCTKSAQNCLYRGESMEFDINRPVQKGILINKKQNKGEQITKYSINWFQGTHFFLLGSQIHPSTFNSTRMNRSLHSPGLVSKNNNILGLSSHTNMFWSFKIT